MATHTNGFHRLLATCRRPDRPSFADAWAGIEPTFQSAKSIRKWNEAAAREDGEWEYFQDAYMLSMQKRVAKAMVRAYDAARRAADPLCVFASVDRKRDVDPWQVRRQNLHFRFGSSRMDDFEMKWGMDPETFEFSVKPVPLAWFYDERFVAFLDLICWKVPSSYGLSPTVVHGGCQFSLSAKTFLVRSLLADDLADHLNHPELALWTMDWPNPDDRSLRATGPRFSAFRRVLEEYWAGAYHPGACGPLTAGDVYAERNLEPNPRPGDGLMGAAGPEGSAREVFQTNFRFARAVRLRAQAVHPGYWQAAHPGEEGYRPDQIMRHSECNLNRMQIAGEWHVKKGTPLDVARAPAPGDEVDASALATDASWEDRGQMGRTSARDFVEALLLHVHRARWLEARPRQAVRPTLLQDMLLSGAEETLRKRDSKRLSELRREARPLNLEYSRGRLRADWVDPEPLLWAVWGAVTARERGALAREIVGAFLEYVNEAASADPRGQKADPMEWHRHRVHPELWKALEATRGELKRSSPLRRELAAFQARRDIYLSRRPVFSHVEMAQPWEANGRG